MNKKRASSSRLVLGSRRNLKKCFFPLRFGLLLGWVLALITCPYANNLAKAEPTWADKETARDLYKRGHDHFAKGNFAAALKAFQAADNIMHVPTTGFEVGRTLAELGRLLEARDQLLRVTRIPEGPAESEPFRHARLHAAQLAQELVKRIPALRVHVSGPPAGRYSLKIDDIAIAPELTEIARKLDPGPHKIVVQAERYVTKNARVSLKEGENRELNLTLQPLAKPSATEPVADDDYSLSPVFFVGLGTAVVGLTVGTITGVVALNRSAELEEQCPEHACTSTQQDDLDSAKTIGHVSTVSFIVAAAGMTTGVVGILLSGSDAQSNATSYDIRLSAGPTGAILSGRF